MDASTVYNNSFLKLNPEDIKICRTGPYLPVNSLHPSKSKIDEHTITKVKLDFDNFLPKLITNFIFISSRFLNIPEQSGNEIPYFHIKDLCSVRVQCKIIQRRSMTMLPNRHANDRPSDEKRI